jgi:hypothetical protein
LPCVKVSGGTRFLCAVINWSSLAFKHWLKVDFFKLR